MEATEIRERVRERYAREASTGPGCESDACCPAGYSAEELAGIPSEAILGLGSGNPVRHAGLRTGEVIVDLGSGAGIDVFLAARRVGLEGRAIGVDMTPAMIERARHAAERTGTKNVEFHLAEIERLPLPDDGVDVVLSNCVINLSPDKTVVFREAFRVLRPGGRLVISDIVQERDLGPIEDDCGCIATAMRRDSYIGAIRAVGFRDPEILEDRPWRTGPSGIEASAITLRATKPKTREVTR